jgi:hypothetical protein
VDLAADRRTNVRQSSTVNRNLHGVRLEAGFGASKSGNAVSIAHHVCGKPRTEVEKEFPWTYEGLDASQGEVAGFWPWMRQGWTYLLDPMDVELGLIQYPFGELVDHLRPGRYVMFDPVGGKRLSELFGLETSQPLPLLQG